MRNEWQKWQLKNRYTSLQEWPQPQPQPHIDNCECQERKS